MHMCVFTVVSDSLQPHGLQSARILCPWNPPGKNTGVGCHSLLQGPFLTQGSNLGVLYCRQSLYCLRLTVKFSHFHLSLWLGVFIRLTSSHCFVSLATISATTSFTLKLIVCFSGPQYLYSKPECPSSKVILCNHQYAE